MTATSRRATLEVAGMTCDACEGHVTAALAKAGATEASAGFRRGVARFAWPEPPGPDRRPRDRGAGQHREESVAKRPVVAGATLAAPLLGFGRRCCLPPVEA